MKRISIGVLASSMILTAAPLFAKGATVRITIQGPGLRMPVEITDPTILSHFRVWTGPGTSSNESEGLIVNWARGAIAERPNWLDRYEVSFYAKLERLVYVVSYEYDSASDQGYVYLPGKADAAYRLNVSTIFRKVEGNWFHASRTWNSIATPLIARAKAAQSAR